MSPFRAAAFRRSPSRSRAGSLPCSTAALKRPAGGDVRRTFVGRALHRRRLALDLDVGRERAVELSREGFGNGVGSAARRRIITMWMSVAIT
jgi:hypothetical protein